MIRKWYYPLLTTILIIGLSIFVFVKIVPTSKEQEIDIDQPVIHQITEEETSLDLKTIIHEANKSVVQIEAISNQVTLTGSGFLFNDQGDIITNAHVIKDTDYIYVKTANAHIYPAAVVDIGEETDIAVIRVPELANHSSLALEIESMIDIGDEIIALGSPHGFQNTVTTGIISGMERNFSVDGFRYDNVLQISAQIMQGNSGGPLISRESGKVVGINSVGTDDGSIGFSIPIHLVYEDINQWSNGTPNDQLTFPQTDDMATNVSDERLEDDATYIIDYFFESITMRDYISAYTLLGSELQSHMSYTEFRDQFIQVIDLNYENINFDYDDEDDQNQIDANVNLDIESHTADEKESQNETVEFEFSIGFENEQLKVLTVDYTN